MTPPTDAIEVSIAGGDSFVLLGVERGHEAMVLGYDGEPYLRFADDGTVFRNRRSYATYYNEDRFGGSEIPDTVDNEAEPDWEQVGDSGTWAWHDHRAHWMDDEPPIGLQPGESLPPATLPIVVDGQPTDITIVTTLQPDPSPAVPVLGLIVGLALVFVAITIGPAATTLALLLLGVASLVVGVGQYRSVPAATGPLITWWLLPAIATTCAIVIIATYRRWQLVERALLALGGAQLFLWAFRRRTALTEPVLPTDLPDGIDRFVTAACLTGGALLVAIGITWLLRPALPQPDEPGRLDQLEA